MSLTRRARAIVPFLLFIQLAHGRLAAQEESAEPATIADLAPKPIPDEQNAAAHLERVVPELEAFGKSHYAYDSSLDGEDFAERLANGVPPTDAQLAAVREILNKHSAIFDALEKAAKCEIYASKLDFTLPANDFLQQVLDRTQRTRILGRAVHWKIHLLLAEGRADEAVQWGSRTLRVLRFRENEPLLVNYLVTSAVHGVVMHALQEAVRSGPISPKMRAELVAELIAEELPALPEAYASERAFVQQSAWEKIEQTRGPGGVIPPALIQWQVSELLKIDAARNNADKEWHMFRDEPGQDIPDAMMLATESRRIMYVRSLRILLALIDYREEHGADASKLDQLGLSEGVTIDPFSGESLQLKSTNDGWVIYSVGNDGKDDGGSLEDGLDGGFAPAGYDARR